MAQGHTVLPPYGSGLGRERAVFPRYYRSRPSLARPQKLQLRINCKNARRGCAKFGHSRSWVASAPVLIVRINCGGRLEDRGHSHGRSQGLIAGRLSSGGWKLTAQGAGCPPEGGGRPAFHFRPTLNLPTRSPLVAPPALDSAPPCMRLPLQKFVNFLIVSARHICRAGVQRKGWSTSRGLLWRTVRAVTPHPCATMGGDAGSIIPGMVSPPKGPLRRKMAPSLPTLCEAPSALAMGWRRHVG
jgi:hypothetical protein